MEYRIGAVHTVQHNSQRGRYGVGVFSVILVGLENRRGIQNWLKIQQTGPDSSVLIFFCFLSVVLNLGCWCHKGQGTVTLATTKEALDKGDLRPYVESRDNFRIGEDTLPVTRFAREMTDLWVLHNNRDHGDIISEVFWDLGRTYGSEPEGRIY